MIVAIPFIKSRADFTKLGVSLNKYAGLKSHILLVTHIEEDADDAADFYNSVKDLFLKAKLLPIPQARDFGHQIANLHFATATKIAGAYTPGDGEVLNPPFLYLDPAYRPVRENWADELQAVYYKSGGHVVGTTKVIADSSTRVENTDVKVEGGRSFVGPVLFEHTFGSRSNMIGFLQPQELWRVSLRWEMLSSYTEAQVFGDGELALLSFFPAPENKASGNTKTVEPLKEPAKVEVPQPQPQSREPEGDGWGDTSDPKSTIVKRPVITKTR